MASCGASNDHARAVAVQRRERGGARRVAVADLRAPRGCGRSARRRRSSSRRDAVSVARARAPLAGPTTTVRRGGVDARRRRAAPARERPRPLRWPTVKRWMPSCRPSTRPRRVDDRRRRGCAPGARALDERGVVVVRDEADLLAVGLVGDRQAAAARAARAPRSSSARRAGTRRAPAASCVSEKRKYDWSFAGSTPRSRRQRPVAGVALDARVVAGRDGARRRTRRARSTSVGELQVAVAVRAGERRAARQVLAARSSRRPSPRTAARG